MSHFSSIKTQLVDQDALVQGLQTWLATYAIAAQLEVHSEPVFLENAYDRRDRREAHIILRRRYLNTQHREALVDVGFVRSQQGVFTAVLDAWDVNQNALAAAISKAQAQERSPGYSQGHQLNPTQAFLAAVQVAHDLAYVERHYPTHLWDYDRQVNADGSVQLCLTQKVDLAAVSASAW